MLGQLNLYGKDKVEQSIDRLRYYEPAEGYYLAFSGGKDSVTVKALMDMAGVKYDAHYNVTSVDPPELVAFVKTFPDVSMDIPTYKDGRAVTIWNLIPYKKTPPTRLTRHCCFWLKEGGGAGRFVVTGVRWAESARRKNKRGGVEYALNKTGQRVLLDPDADREAFDTAEGKVQTVLNPIIDWEDADVWEFIHGYGVRYCSLYNEGFTRLGCIGCPMATRKEREKEFNRWPKYKENYLKAFARMLEARKERGLPTQWKTPEEVMEWWLYDK